jgi:hypothetical protein
LKDSIDGSYLQPACRKKELILLGWVIYHNGMVFADLDYVKVNDNFKGMTLSDWLGEWVQWLHGATVEYTAQPGEIMHTRGGLSYQYLAGVAGASRIQSETKHVAEVNITNKVPVYINILTSFYFIGEKHPRGNLETLTEVMTASIDDFERSRVVTETIQKDNEKPKDLRHTLVQANNISIRVHPDSLLADSFEMPVEKGVELRGCAVSFFCLIRSLPPGKYKVITSNSGVRGYKSESEYTINVTLQLPSNIQ